MNCTHLSAVSLTLIIYAILAVAYFGWGKATTYLLGLERQESRPVTSFVWMGWAFTLLVFQLIHFVLPLKAFVAIFVLIMGATFAIPQIITAYRRYINQLSMRTLLILLGIIAVVLTLCGWIASLSMLSPESYDSGLYHFNKIRWINSFPIVPGLGNLHGRLAFNQSHFEYVAALNLYPFFGHGCSIANSFLFLLTIATFADLLRPVFKRPPLLVEAHPFQYTSIIIAFPALAYLAFSSTGFSSPSPDLTSTLLQLTMFLMFAQDIVEWIKGERLNAHRAIVLAIVAVTAITIKLSNLAFSAVIIGFCIVRVWQTLHIRGAVRVILPVVVVILVWGCRGYLLSGAPLYPSTIGYVSAEWAVPRVKVVDEANWVYSWARQPGRHWSHVLGSWEWFRPWTILISEDKEGVVYPLVVAVVFCIITMMLVFVYKKKARVRWSNYAILIPVVFGLVYWFFTAPDPRFVGALFWCLSLSSALLFLSSIQSLLKKRSFAGVLCVVFIVTNLYFMEFVVTKRYKIKAVSSSGWHSIKTVPLVRKETSSGLVVFTPEQGDQCWDAPLPCTPYFNSILRLRIP